MAPAGASLLDTLPPTDVPVDARNRRTHGRAPLPGTAAYLSPHRVLIARMGDVSAGGAFLSTAFPDPIGTRATLELELAASAGSARTRVQLDVEVVRVSFFGGRDGRGAGMGVTFIDVPREIRRRLVSRDDA